MTNPESSSSPEIAESTPAVETRGEPPGGLELPAGLSPSEATTTEATAAAVIDEYEELTPELVEDEAIRGDFVIRWAVILLAFLLASTKVGESLTLVQIRTGQYLAAHGWLPPATDVFSYSAADRPWRNLAWGFDLILGAVYNLAGFPAVSALKALLAAAAFGVLAHVGRRNQPTWWTSICAGLALLACHLRMSAHPTLITCLGLAILLWELHRFRERTNHGEPASLWRLIPLFAVWCNLDSRAFIGMTALLLYLAGDWLGACLRSSTSLVPAARRQLAWTALASIAALLLHPWHLHSVLAPSLIYGTEYPAIREFVTQSYVGEPRPVFGSEASYFPLWYGGLWQTWDYAGVAAVVLFLLAVVLFLFNLRRLVWGELLAFLGMTGLAVISIRELPAASLVFAVVAGLNGQAWYASNFSLAYTTNPWELFFSRAGRAMTVLTLAVVAFFGGTGRLRDATAPQSGYGLDNNLASLVGDLQARLIGLDAPAVPTAEGPATAAAGAGSAEARRKSFDDQPFNFTVSHGDALIWIGQKPFFDSRLIIYHDREEERNLLATAQKVRRALEAPRVQGEGELPGGRALRASQEKLLTEQQRQRRAYWRGVFDQFGVTHVVLRMSTTGRAAQDIQAFSDLLNSKPADWKLVELGAGCAVVYRTDIETPVEKRDALREFLKDRKVDFGEQAFKTSAPFLSARDRWVRTPSFYQRHLWSQRREISPAIQQAMQYVHLATLPSSREAPGGLVIPDVYAGDRAALALLAIRKAQQGLQDDPDSYWGYMVLGEAYSALGRWEAFIAQNPARIPTSGLRYFEAMAAYSQALVSVPDDIDAHRLLANAYRDANRTDLELRHQKQLQRLLDPLPDFDAEVKLQVDSRIRELEKRVATARERDDQYQQQQRGVLERAIELAQQGFVLMAIEILNKEAEARTGNLAAEQFRIILQTEAGLAEEAHDNAERFTAPAQNARIANWQDPVAFANLPNADFPKAQSLWQQKIDEAGKGAFSGLLSTLAPRPQGLGGWPLSTTGAAYNWFFQKPQTVGETRLNLALIYLEEGNLAATQRELELSLAANPETPDRNLILHYLSELRGSEVDFEPFAPSQTVPGLFATDEEFATRDRLTDEFTD